MTDEERVQAIIRLSGFALAHAAWSVCDGEALCTLAFTENNQERQLYRFEANSIPDSLNAARKELEQLEAGAHWVLVFDGYFTSQEGEKQDALVIQPSGARSLPSRIVQLYRKKSFFTDSKSLASHCLLKTPAKWSRLICLNNGLLQEFVNIRKPASFGKSGLPKLIRTKQISLFKDQT